MLCLPVKLYLVYINFDVKFIPIDYRNSLLSFTKRNVTYIGNLLSTSQSPQWNLQSFFPIDRDISFFFRGRAYHLVTVFFIHI